jgi:2-methylfumaryl-CoA isomerase
VTRPKERPDGLDGDNSVFRLLSNVRVVEGASFVAGPYCAMLLSQLGAEVIRFDAIGGGLDIRRWPLGPNGASLYWEGLNKGKKSVALNLRVSEGRELAVAIAALEVRSLAYL